MPIIPFLHLNGIRDKRNLDFIFITATNGSLRGSNGSRCDPSTAHFKGIRHNGSFNIEEWSNDAYCQGSQTHLSALMYLHSLIWAPPNMKQLIRMLSSFENMRSYGCYILLGGKKFAYAFAYVPASAYVCKYYSYHKNLPFSFPERHRKTGPDIRHAQAARPHAPHKSLMIHH